MDHEKEKTDVNPVVPVGVHHAGSCRIGIPARGSAWSCMANALAIHAGDVNPTSYETLAYWNDIR